VPLTFIPMSDADFAAFMRKSIPEYAYDQTRVGNWTQAEAMGRAQAEFQQMLPQGPSTPNQVLSVIVNEADQKLGMIWYFLDTSRPRVTIFLIDFFIFSEYRGKGYDSAALAMLEDEWRAKGAQRVELQVFTHREELTAYRQAAYQETSVYLAKNL